jgi:hypothetical protein
MTVSGGDDLAAPLVYKPPPGEGSLQNLYGAQTIYHSKSLCYKPPPERGHLSRTGHIGGGAYKPVNTVLCKMVCTPYKFCSDPPLGGGLIYASGTYSEGGTYMLVDTVLRNAETEAFILEGSIR